VRSPRTHCVRLDHWPPTGKGEIWVSNSQSKHAIAHCSQTVGPVLPPGKYKRIVSDSAFQQITMVLVRTSQLVYVILRARVLCECRTRAAAGCRRDNRLAGSVSRAGRPVWHRHQYEFAQSSFIISINQRHVSVDRIHRRLSRTHAATGVRHSIGRYRHASSLSEGDLVSLSAGLTSPTLNDRSIWPAPESICENWFLPTPSSSSSER